MRKPIAIFFAGLDTMLADTRAKVAAWNAAAANQAERPDDGR